LAKDGWQKTAGKKRLAKDGWQDAAGAGCWFYCFDQ
jgi:hypothetical protein